MRKRQFMDDFNHFFDDQRETQPQHTPVYHTPEPKNRNKLNAVTIICIVVAAVMCVVVLVNVIVLASMKQTIAEEYAASISASMKEQYRDAINETLNDTDIVNDITDNATQEALEKLNYAVGQVADKYCSASVARLYMYTDSSSNVGVASGFLITDTDASGTTQRYLLTNAHCARYVTKVHSSRFPFTTTYSWASYNSIVAIFDNEEVEYKTEIVAFGGYDDPDLKAENDQADIALLRIVGTQPSNDAHPSLELVTADANRGDPVALIGNPEGIGDKNAITSGTVTLPNVTDKKILGNGTFIMTDAAVNPGNSGGPMVNILGKVVGIVESKLADESIDNMGFALSADTIRDFISWAQKSSNNLLGSDLSKSFSRIDL